MSERIEAIRARLAAVTPGPLVVGAGRATVPLDGREMVCVVSASTRKAIALTGVVGADDEQESMANADLIAHAPADIAFLLAEVEKWESLYETTLVPQLKDYKAEVERLRAALRSHALTPSHNEATR